MLNGDHTPITAAKPSEFDSQSIPGNLRSRCPKKGTWFRPEVDLREPEGSELVTAISSELARVENRTRALRAQDASNRTELVRRIAANALACQTHRVRPYVAFMAMAAFYQSGPLWLNGASMRRTVNLLERCGLVDAWPGSKGRVSSIYAPRKSLLKLFGEYNVKGSSLIENLPPNRLVRLRKSNRNGPEVSFQETEQTGAWIAQIQAYNHFVGLHELSVNITDVHYGRWLHKLNERDKLNGLPFRRPELFRTNLFRTFNNGSFDHGGRLYGAWWTNAPREIRRSIKINGSDTVEHDYSGHAIRMLYHEKGLGYQGDPYCIKPLWDYAKENQLPEDHFREAVKNLTQALINGSSGGRPEQARISDFTFKPFKRAEVRKMIEARHPEISDAFLSGAGLQLQRKDSDLALTIISNLMGKGILALPVHDSFLVEEKFEQELINEMEHCYLNFFGFQPLVKREY